MHSYNDWYAKGYHVKKGERHIKRDAKGVPLFSLEQVERNFIPRPYPVKSKARFLVDADDDLFVDDNHNGAGCYDADMDFAL